MSGDGERRSDVRARRCGEAVARALAEDLGPEGDLTAALVPEDVHGALRAARPSARRAGRP